MSTFRQADVTAGQWQQLRDRFTALSSDGTVDLDQFKDVMTSINLPHLATGHVFRLFDRGEHAGRISYREFVHSLLALCGKADLNYRFIFDVFDARGEGKISYHDFRFIFWGVFTDDIKRWAMESGIVCPTVDLIEEEQEKALAKEFASIDCDKTGEIDFNAFTRWYRSESAAAMLERTIFSAIQLPR